jgi:hypothetical protein
VAQVFRLVAGKPQAALCGRLSRTLVALPGRLSWPFVTLPGRLSQPLFAAVRT